MRRLALLLLFLLVLLPARAAAVAPPPSWFLPLHEAGDDWPETVYTVAIAFGDVDGDGRDEVAIARNALSGPRLFLLDDAAANFAPLWTYGETWGAGSYATSVALGNVDDDPLAEIALTRATSVNDRAFLFDDADAGFAPLEAWGADWGPSVHAIDVALGDGPAAVAVANNATGGPRVFVFGGAADSFAPQWTAGDTWGAAAVATAVAFGDTDGDGTDELGITRRHDTNARVFLHAAAGGALLWDTGETWGIGNWATDIAFGNVDDDPEEEIGVARKSGLNERAFVFDYVAADDDFTQLMGFGQTWNPDAYATAIAFGDVDDDGRAEVAIARVVSINARVFVHDDALAETPFAALWGYGEGWPGDDYATAVAFGATDSAPGAELGIGRRATAGARAFIFERGWATHLPYAAVPEEETADFADYAD